MRASGMLRRLVGCGALAILGPVPADPSNRHADDTLAARLGRRLFFDARLSGDGKVSCATCHVPSQGFQDGRPLGPGDYAVEGMKFNMGGWWVVKFRVAADAGRDSVTFNLKL